MPPLDYRAIEATTILTWGDVTKAWARLAWVTCLLEFKDRQRVVMTPGKYTELFFLDEATALAAGHRPCATCRRSAYEAFKAHWLAANPPSAAGGGIQAMDKLLHAERVDGNRQKRTWQARSGGLPEGTMAVRPGARQPLLVWQGAAYPWTPGRYLAPQLLAPETIVEVLTPRSVVRVLEHGYVPAVHGSIASASD